MHPRGAWERLRWQRRGSVAERTRIPCIYVLAGTNGAGKSSVAGAMFLAQRAGYFNPDEAANRILSANPGVTQAEANSAAWREGKRLLERAIAERLSFAFETTLGGHTIAALLESALLAGVEVRIWYVGLSSAELHITRVRARAAKGGHDIHESKIRERFDSSRLNLIRLMLKLTELRVYDNSDEADPDQGVTPEPKLLLHMAGGKIVSFCPLSITPEWAKPIFGAALKWPLREAGPE
jgi:predicted ABC-type ATPase